MKKIIILPLLVFWAACAPEKKETQIQETAPVALPTSNRTETKTVSGKIIEIQTGKDGYTAKLMTSGQEIYWITISHANLENQQQYRSAAVGDQLEVSGELWQMNNENHITARHIL